MPYIGNTIRAADDYRLIDDISSGFNGSETSFALQVAGSAPVPFPKSPQQVLISVNGVIQEPDPTGSSGFNLVGTNIVFSSAPTNGHAFFGIIYATADYLNAGGNFPAGSLGAPSITFIGDENTGLFRKSGGSVGFVSDATEIANFDSNGITISSGNIIIPDSIIHGGDSDTKIRFPSANVISFETAGVEKISMGTGEVTFNETGADVDFRIEGDTNANLFKIDAGNERVGIGLASPSMPFHVYNAAVNGVAKFESGDANAVITIADNSGEVSIRAQGNQLAFNTSSSETERMRIDASGNVGIGTTSPALLQGDGGRVLHIAGTANPEIVLERTTSGTEAKASIRITDTEDFRIAVKDGSATTIDALAIDSTTGNVGIGTTSPDQKLVVADTSSVSLIRVTANNAQEAGIDFGDSDDNDIGRIRYDNNANLMRFFVNAAERLRITSAGNVGIGTTSPARLLTLFNNDQPVFQITNNTSGSANTRGLIQYIASGTTDAVIDNQGSGSGGVFRVMQAGNERLRIDSSGNVGIGTTNPGQRLEVRQTSASHAIIACNRPNSDTFAIALGNNSSNNGIISVNQTDLLFGEDNAGTFSEFMRLDSSGRLLIGLSTTATTDSNAHSRLQAVTSAGPNFLLGRDDSDTAINSRLGVINFASNHGGTFHEVVTIRAAADAQHEANSKASRLELYTTGTGNTSATRRMTIDKDGVTHFGGTDSLNDSNVVSIIPSDGRISFGMDGRNSLVTGENGAYIFSGSGASGDILAGELVIQTRSNTNRDLHFATGATPKMRGRFRGADGDFFLGDDLGSITNLGTAFRENDAGTNHSSYIEIGHGTTGANYSYIIFRFGGSGTAIGSIAQNSSGNGVIYNTSSDYRLKTNEALITDGITRIKQLKPYKFEWKSDLGTKVDGFFAHEVSSIVPEAITGEKDAVETTYYEDDEKHIPEGKSIGDVKETDRPVYQSIDHSKLVPLLTAALQEEIAKREALEARVAALEAA